MRKNPKNPDSQSGLFAPRILLAFTLCSVGVFLAALGFAATPTPPGWSLITSPNTDATQTNYLNGVTCASPNDCWAVGYYNISGTVAQTLIEHWNGASWSIASSPNSSATQTNHLNDVVCASALDCWAVGYYYTGSGVGGYAQTLVEHWNGTSWSIAPSNNSSATQNNYLFGVTCASAANCWAVGSFFNGSYTQTLIERWDGISWATATSPLASYYLNKVTCTSASDCWAVGSTYPTGSSHAHTLIEHWDGASWSIAPSPDPTDVGDNYLSSVTCASPSYCWAVGYYDPNGTGGETALPFIENWNGLTACATCPKWSIFPSPNIGVAYLTGVTCTSASQCWAVGHGIDPSATNPAYYTVIEQLNGSSWQLVTSPSRPFPNNNYLYGVACASASECWAVGYSGYNQAGPHSQTLIEEFAPTIPPLGSVVSRMTHGSAGTFDITLPLTGTRGVECRSSATLGAGNYAVVFTFVNNVTNCGTAGTTGGSVSPGPNPNQCTENLTGVADQQYTTVTLNNVLDSQNNTGNVSATMGVLVGDVNASGIVTSGDTNLCKAQALKPVTNANFRNDINASGSITTGDVNIIKQNALHQLPSPP